MCSQRAVLGLMIVVAMSVPAMAGDAVHKDRRAAVPLAAFGALAGAVAAISAAGREAYYGPYYTSRVADPAPLVSKQVSGRF